MSRSESSAPAGSGWSLPPASPSSATRSSCSDIVPERIAELEAGRVPIHEPGLEELVEKNRARLHFTLDTADVFERARIAFVCVATPPTYSGEADSPRVPR